MAQAQREWFEKDYYKVLGVASNATPEEIKKAAAYNLRPAPMERAWDLWAMRLARKEGR